MSGKLAVIVPTRSRPENVVPIVTAWWQTGAFDAADLWVSYDQDDIRVDAYTAILSELAEVRAISNPAWRPLVPKLNNSALSLVRYHEYPWVAFMGDDHIPRTQRWAHMLVEQLATARQPSIVYGRDGHFDRRLPSWWAMDGRIVDLLGRMVPAPVQHLFCDNAVLELGKAANNLIYDERILVEHMHPLFGKAKSDAQYERVNRKQQYERDGTAFREWMGTGLDADVTIVHTAGG